MCLRVWSCGGSSAAGPPAHPSPHAGSAASLFSKEVLRASGIAALSQLGPHPTPTPIPCEQGLTTRKPLVNTSWEPGGRNPTVSAGGELTASLASRLRADAQSRPAPRGCQVLTTGGSELDLSPTTLKPFADLKSYPLMTNFNLCRNSPNDRFANSFCQTQTSRITHTPFEPGKSK